VRKRGRITFYKQIPKNVGQDNKNTQGICGTFNRNFIYDIAWDVESWIQREKIRAEAFSFLSSRAHKICMHLCSLYCGLVRFFVGLVCVLCNVIFVHRECRVNGDDLSCFF